jgi:hypothetical protein
MFAHLGDPCAGLEATERVDETSLRRAASSVPLPEHVGHGHVRNEFEARVAQRAAERPAPRTAVWVLQARGEIGRVARESNRLDHAPVRVDDDERLDRARVVASHAAGLIDDVHGVAHGAGAVGALRDWRARDDDRLVTVGAPRRRDEKRGEGERGCRRAR